MPFVAALILAYLLDPMVDWMERRGLSRIIGTSLVLLFFVLIFVVLLLAALPLLVNQLAALIAKLPEYIARLQVVLTEQGGALIERFGGPDRLKEIQGQLSSGLGDAARWLGGFVTSLLSGGQAIIGLISLLVLTPVVAFYMILDWDHMVAKVDSWLPLAHRDTIRELVREMDASWPGFCVGKP